MKHTFRFITIIVCLAIFCSCSKLEFFNNETNTSGDITLDITNSDNEPVSALTFTREGCEISAKVISNSDWTALVDPKDKEWCNANPPSSSGNGKLLIRVKRNENIDPRSTNISIVCNNNIRYTLKIIQAGVPLLSATRADVPMFKNSCKLTIAANGEWTAKIEENKGWCTLSAYSGTEGIVNLIITSERNISGANRSAAIKFSNEGIEESFTVYQSSTVEPFTPYLSDNDTLKLSWNKIKGATGYRINVTSDSRLSQSYDVDSSVTHYFPEQKEGNLFNFIGSAKIVVEALTEDSEEEIKGATLYAHTLFDVNSGNGIDIPYLISNRRHFNNIRKVLTGNYRIVSNIDFSGYSGDSENSNGNFPMISNDFSGILDGNNMTISNLKLNLAETTPMGLLQNVSGEIKNLHINGMNAVFGTGGIAGGLIGQLTGKITDCSITNSTITRNVNNVLGGMAGELTSNATIEGCKNINTSVSASSNNNTGGIVGRMISGEIKGCSNSGSILCSNSGGGIAGTQQGGSVLNCFNTGGISAPNNAGGIVGNQTGGQILMCYNTNTVTGSNNIGGIAGKSTSALIETCYNKGNIDATGGDAGGIAARSENNTGIIRNCYNTGAINATINAAGICANIQSNTTSARVSECYNTGSISSTATLSGGIVAFIPQNSSVIIANCYYLENSSVSLPDKIKAGVEMKTDLEMGTEQTFSGWDFSQKWHFIPESDYRYPQLRSITHQ